MAKGNSLAYFIVLLLLVGSGLNLVQHAGLLFINELQVGSGPFWLITFIIALILVVLLGGTPQDQLGT